MGENDDKQYILERKRRLRIIIIMLPAFVAAFLVLFRDIISNYFFGYYQQGYFYTSIIIGCALASSLLGVLMMYLQTGFTLKAYGDGEFSPDHNETEKTGVSFNDLKRLNKQTDLLNEEFNALRLEVNEFKKITDLSTEKEELVATLKLKIMESATEDFLQDIKEEVNKELLSNNLKWEIRKGFSRTLERISREIVTLNRRGNLNLALGITVTLAGLYLLYSYLFRTDITVNSSTVVIFTYYAPRLSLVIFTEIFAYFFLRLYKETLAEIKYYQNEMTNMEAKYISLITVLELNNQDVIAHVTINLSDTERNSLDEKLNKNQIKHAMILKDSILDILAKSVDIVKKSET